MIALVSDERVQQLANECIELSKRTDDAVTATELLKLSNRVLQLATPTLPAMAGDSGKYLLETTRVTVTLDDTCVAD